MTSKVRFHGYKLSRVALTMQFRGYKLSWTPKKFAKSRKFVDHESKKFHFLILPRSPFELLLGPLTMLLGTSPVTTSKETLKHRGPRSVLFCFRSGGTGIYPTTWMILETPLQKHTDSYRVFKNNGGASFYFSFWKISDLDPSVINCTTDRGILFALRAQQITERR